MKYLEDQVFGPLVARPRIFETNAQHSGRLDISDTKCYSCEIDIVLVDALLELLIQLILALRFKDKPDRVGYLTPDPFLAAID